MIMALSDADVGSCKPMNKGPWTMAVQAANENPKMKDRNYLSIAEDGPCLIINEAAQALADSRLTICTSNGGKGE